MKDIFKDCTLFVDTESGFAYAGKTDTENLFQVCLMERKDGKGYRKAIKRDNSGYNDGVCGDYNENQYPVGLDNVYSKFTTFARSMGMKIL